MKITDNKGNEIVVYDNGNIPKGLEIRFEGFNNLLYIDGNTVFENSSFVFRGNGAIAYIGKNLNVIYVDVTLSHNGTCYMGENIYINPKGGTPPIIDVFEGQNVVIGRDCIIGCSTVMMTSDAHLIYDSKTKKRINEAKSIYIGDHVWIGARSIILKGGVIGSGSIIGVNSTVCSGTYGSGKVFAGNPAKERKKDICFLLGPAAFYESDRLSECELLNSDEGIFKKDHGTLDLEETDSKLKSIYDAKERMQYLIDEIASKNDHNRFYIE